MGEELGAWVHPRAGVAPDLARLRAFVRERLAHYKAPRYLWLVQEFPLTVTGKIQKFAIRDTVAAWQREGDPRFAAADLASRSAPPPEGQGS
jgi:acyl-CoA synthetase (AMP-forming)/AMP-acid ligase II